MTLREELQVVLDALLEKCPPGHVVSIDLVGEEIGARFVTPPEIEAIFAALEGAGRTVGGLAEGPSSTLTLQQVLRSARELRTGGRRPGVREIAAHAGLSEQQVRTALHLAQVMQR